MTPLFAPERRRALLEASTSPRVWLAVTLVVSLVYSLPILGEAFSAANVVQDDARQHVFWMQRFVDPTLFPDDLIADYFESVAPPGYAGLYWLAAKLGIPPLLFHKLLPLPLLLLTVVLCFSLTLQLYPSPAAAAISSLLLAQGLWLTDAIVSATPKAFIYPLLLGLLYTLAQHRLWGTAVVIGLQGIFYPQLALISVVVLLLRLVDWRRWRPGMGKRYRDRYRMAAVGIAVAMAVLLPYALQSHGYGPTLTAVEARSLPEMSLPGSRAQFFDTDPTTYWLQGRSGLRLATALTPVTNVLGLLLPLVLWRCRSPLLERSRSLALLPQLVAASLVMFVMAHLLLFRLHLPSRYTQHSLRVVLSIAAAIAIVALVDSGWRWARSRRQRAAVLALVGLVGLSVLLYPVGAGGPITAYQVGQETALYSFLRRQPADSLVASLSLEGNNLPSFTGRSLLVGSEYAIPYHTGYYRQIRDRAQRLIDAQYSADPKVVQRFIEDYGVTHWLLDRNAFRSRYVQNNLLMQQYPEFAAAAERTMGTATPVLQRFEQRDQCIAFRQQGRILLDAICLRQSLMEPSP